MSTAIMQQLPEMFLVFLESDLPGMLALFLCGIVGWFATKYVNSCYSTLAQIKAKAKIIDADQCDGVGSSKLKTRPRKRSNRSPKANVSSRMHGANIEVDPLCASITYTTDVADDVTTGSSAAGAQCESDLKEQEWKHDARTTKIMAKKAERKYRQAQHELFQPKQEGDPHGVSTFFSESQNQAASPLLASDILGAPKPIDACTLQEFGPNDERIIASKFDPVAATEQTGVPASCPHVLAYVDQARGESDKMSCNEEDVHSTADEEEDNSYDANIARPEGSTTPCGDSGKTTSCGASEATPSEDSNSACDGYSTSEDTWGVGQVAMPPILHLQNDRRLRTEIDDDGWMASFEDAAKDQQLPATPDQERSFVHIDASTGNEVWFEPVQRKDDGTQLYTDGQQLYQAVCVRVEDLMSSHESVQVKPPETAFQSLPADSIAFQGMSNDAVFQSFSSPTTLQHQGCGLGFATPDGPCCQQVPSDGTEYTHLQIHSDDESLWCPMTVEGINNPCILNILNPQNYSLSSKMVEEDEAWNMCWDFVSSAWNS